MPAIPKLQRLALASAFASVAGLALAASANGQDSFADAVVSYTIGTNGGFGEELLPAVVLGPPRGLGSTEGSTDVLALGGGGRIVLRFDEPVICNGPGVDFTVFENAFHSGAVEGPIFDELAFVEVSQDGVHFVEFPFDRVSLDGLAGRSPVLSHPENGVDPLDPAVSGGDGFDLADVGLAWASYVRITDVDGEIPDVGDLPPFLPPPNAGFDLDAVAAVNACSVEPNTTPTPTETPRPVSTPSPTTTETVSATSTPSATATATTIPRRSGDLDDDGSVTAFDEDLLIEELYDGDGSDPDHSAAGDLALGPFADVNRDRTISAADLVAIVVRRDE